MSSTDYAVDNTVSLPPAPESAEAWQIKPGQILSSQELTILNQKSNVKGFLQLAGHLAVMAGSGYLWATQMGHGWVSIPALVVYGFSLASMFAAMHECVHRTAFASNQINDIVAWLAGLLSFYNGTFYRRYHKWHHRYTQIPGKDPEVGDPPAPTDLPTYLLQMSGIPWWLGKVRTHLRIATGQVEHFPYISDTARSQVISSVRLQLAVYGAAIGLSLALQQPWFLLYWALPLAVGQPILRVILLSEHTGCTNDDNYLSNTRTTLTFWPLRFLMWNMPFHAEHHLYAAIPFHALPAAHARLGRYFTWVEPGYIAVHRGILSRLGQAGS